MIPSSTLLSNSILLNSCCCIAICLTITSLHSRNSSTFFRHFFVRYFFDIFSTFLFPTFRTQSYKITRTSFERTYPLQNFSKRSIIRNLFTIYCNDNNPLWYGKILLITCFISSERAKNQPSYHRVPIHALGFHQHNTAHTCKLYGN